MHLQQGINCNSPIDKELCYFYGMYCNFLALTEVLECCTSSVMMFKDVPLRTRRALLGDSVLEILEFSRYFPFCSPNKYEMKVGFILIS